jgi:hypothetical protein
VKPVRYGRGQRPENVYPQGSRGEPLVYPTIDKTVSGGDDANVQVLQAHRPGHARSMVVEDLLTMRRAGQHDAVRAIIGMVGDLKANERDCRYLKALAGTPIWELKTRARGGQKGGARVYLYWLNNQPVLCGAEVKTDSTASAGLLAEALAAYFKAKKEITDG